MNYVTKRDDTVGKVSPLTEYFTEVIYGGIDGIVTTFAVVAGFSGAALSNDTTTQLTFLVALLFGLANLFADAASMGLGNFLSVRSEKDLYKVTRDREARKIRETPDVERITTVAIMMEKGFSETEAKTLVDVYQKNHEYWLDFIMNHKLEMSDPRGTNPALTGGATFLSFIFFGSIPLLPFIFLDSGVASVAFYYSMFGTFFALTLLGLLKWRVAGVSVYSALVEVWLVGGVAATIAYYVGTFFAI